MIISTDRDLQRFTLRINRIFGCFHCFHCHRQQFFQFPAELIGSALDDFSGASCCEALAFIFLLEGFEFLKKALEEGYFEDLIRKYLLDNTHGAILSLVPEKGLAAKRDKELEEKLGL